ncbi:MAG: leucine-rich repeat domain-containing protein [Caldilineales bacterium]
MIEYLRRTRWALLIGLLLLALAVVPAFAAEEGPALACAGVTEIPLAECQALEALYTATNGAQWKERSGWTLTTTPCSWYGVSCQAGHVSALILDDNNLTGTLPIQLGNLTYLRTLTLPRNLIGGALPTTLGNLIALQTLDISENQLTGALPTQLGSLAALQTLNLSNNQLSGSIPGQLANLSHLQELNLSTNQLSGSIPAALGTIGTLQKLHLNTNLLTGSIPAQLGNLTALHQLVLADNNLSGAIPAGLGNLNQLTHLVLTKNGLSGTIPPELGNLNQLSVLMLNRNRLTGIIPTSLGNLSNLFEVWLNGNALSGAVPENVCSLAGLFFLDTGYNALSRAPACMTLLDPQWNQTQTIAPADLAAQPQSTAITLRWTPILYQNDTGWYEVSYRPAGGMWAVHGQTSSKASTDYTITGLNAGRAYELRVRTFTAAHDEPPAYQQNDVWSDYATVNATTLPSGSTRTIFLPLVLRTR